MTENIKIDVLATHPLSSLTYQVFSKGDIVVSEIVNVPNTKIFQIEFTPSMAMVPSARVIVFYITSDGEIISDSTQINFENELNNFVSK